MAIYFLLGQLTAEGQRKHADAPPPPSSRPRAWTPGRPAPWASTRSWDTTT